MKKIIIILSVAFVALSSCQSLKEEWDPVFTIKNEDPAAFVPYTEATLPGFAGEFTTIQDLKALYKGGGVEIAEALWIKGQVISSDVSGNIYRELYIQDDTGGIDVKIGKSSLYSEYKIGQWVYVNCKGLTLGAYNGMPQLGMAPDQTTTNEYETSYIDEWGIINSRIFRGEFAEPLAPVEVSENMLKAALSAGYTGELWGKYVVIKGLKYDNQIFALVYPNPNLPHKSTNPENRVFLSDKGTWNINTWALSKARYINAVQVGQFDTAEVGSGNTRYGPITGKPSEYLSDGKVLGSFGRDADLTYKEIMVKYATANYVSHYFTIGKTSVQVRTSGFAKFADDVLHYDITDGGHTCDITGILSLYSGSAQFTLVDEPSVSVKIN